MGNDLYNFFKAYKSSKMHLFHLPPVPAKQYPQWHCTGKQACVVIPIFAIDKNSEALTDFVTQSAIWAMRCWKLNTDARKHNVPCYIYAEAESYDRIRPILTANAIPETDVLIFENEDFGGQGKKLNAFFDKRFLEYQHLIIADCDLFPIAGTHEPLTFFKKLPTAPMSGIGVARMWHIENETFDESEVRYWTESLKVGTTEEWYAHLKEIVSERVYNIFTQGTGEFTYPWAAYYITNPAEMINHKRWRNFFVQSRVFNNDEASVSVWEKVFRKGTLYDAEQTLDAPVIHDLTHLQFYQRLNQQADTPVFLHAGESPDFYFQKMIGVFEAVWRT